MKTWKKITISILLLLIIGLLLHILLWSNASEPGEDEDGRPDPIFPFSGSGSDSDGGDFFDDDTTGSDDEQTQTASRPNLWQISDRPVAGSQWVTNEQGEREIWYVHRENGHLFSHSTESRESTRLTNTTIPRIQEVFISPEGDYVLYRYVDKNTQNVKTYIANLSSSSEAEVAYSTDGSFFPDNLTAVDISPSGDRIFSIESTSDGAVGVVNTISDAESKVVFTSPLQEWRSDWFSDDTILLYTKPAVNSDGAAFIVDINTSNESKVAQGYGLTTSMSPDGSYILNSKQQDGSYQTQLSQSENSRESLLSSPTLGEKCGWATNSNAYFCGIPDELSSNPLKNWYQGQVSHTDQLAIFNVNNRNQENLFSEEEMEMGPFDIIDIKVDPDFSFLSFENKRDHILWGLEL